MAVEEGVLAVDVKVGDAHLAIIASAADATGASSR
jgi:hypothetical protein